jgi:hypothetical protein
VEELKGTECVKKSNIDIRNTRECDGAHRTLTEEACISRTFRLETLQTFKDASLEWEQAEHNNNVTKETLSATNEIDIMPMYSSHAVRME